MIYFNLINFISVNSYWDLIQNIFHEKVGYLITAGFDLNDLYIGEMTEINIKQALTFGFSLTLIGMLGILYNRKNLIILLMSIELMLLGLSFNFIVLSVFSVVSINVIGIIMSLLILTTAAGESAIGLAIIIIYFRKVGNIELSNLNLLSG